jgi:hypothetical protein
MAMDQLQADRVPSVLLHALFWFGGLLCCVQRLRPTKDRAISIALSMERIALLFKLLVVRHCTPHAMQMLLGVTFEQ